MYVYIYIYVHYLFIYLFTYLFVYLFQDIVEHNRRNCSNSQYYFDLSGHAAQSTQSIGTQTGRQRENDAAQACNPCKRIRTPVKVVKRKPVAGHTKRKLLKNKD